MLRKDINSSEFWPNKIKCITLGTMISWAPVTLSKWSNLFVVDGKIRSDFSSSKRSQTIYNTTKATMHIIQRLRILTFTDKMRCHTDIMRYNCANTSINSTMHQIKCWLLLTRPINSLQLSVNQTRWSKLQIFCPETCMGTTHIFLATFRITAFGANASSNPHYCPVVKSPALLTFYRNTRKFLHPI